MGDRVEHQTFWESRLSAEWTDAGVGYRHLGRAFNAWTYRVREEVFHREIARLGIDVSRARVLDVGSGTGRYVRAWQQAGAPSITGCDLTEAAVQRLREQFPDVRFVHADVGAMTGVFERASYDAVSCVDVLFDITDDEHYGRALHNLARVIRPGGALVLSENFLRRREQRAERQVHRTFGAIRAGLENAGFRIVRRVPLLVLMNAQVDAPYVWRKLWGGVLRGATLTEPTGWLAGSALYPLERRLTRWLRESPTTELMVCSRAG